MFIGYLTVLFQFGCCVAKDETRQLLCMILTLSNTVVIFLWRDAWKPEWSFAKQQVPTKMEDAEYSIASQRFDKYFPVATNKRNNRRNVRNGALYSDRLEVIKKGDSDLINGSFAR
jgi:hypothetical protein